jgi:hypothetical protein
MFPLWLVSRQKTDYQQKEREGKNMEEMTWQEPPKAVRYKRNSIDWASISDALKENPNEWAVVAHNVNPSVVTHIRKGRLKAFAPAGAFEASGQGRNENGYTQDLYVRFVGTVEETAIEAEEESAVYEATANPEYRVVNVAEEVEVTEEATASASPSSTNPFDFFNDPEL